MPLVIPPFVQYQAPMYPLRGLWNSPPPEGDRFISCELDWGSNPPGDAVQFQLSGNSPLAFSQIVCLVVDNGRCGSDVQFIFPDSGWILIVPAYAQGVFPVFTNALQFYAAAVLPPTINDVTSFMVLNSMPPPVAIQESSQQQQVVVSGISITSNGTHPLIPASVSGTIEGFSIVLSGASSTAGGAVITLTDGQGNQLWTGSIEIPVGPYSQTINVTGLKLRFYQGVNLVVTASTGLTAAGANVNLYYGVP